jgi:hypothetical protein
MTTSTEVAPYREGPTEPVAPRPDARKVASIVYVVAVVIYAIFAGDRLKTHSPDNHFAYLADAYLHGTLSVRCDASLVPAGETCPPGGGGNDWARYNDRWFVAFPSFPAVVYAPFVAALGRNFRNRVLDVLLAGLAPALLYLFLEKLSKKGHSLRSWRENVALAALFAFGTVYFYTSVQGSVWFLAHVVGCALGAGYLLAAIDCERPLLAGVLLGLMFHTRTSMLFGALFFGMEALRTHRKPDETPSHGDASAFARLVRWLRGVDWPAALRTVVRFSIPVLVFIALYMVLNKRRFDSWTEPGYRYLQIRWQARINRWGLFNYHYLSRNLGVALALLPWATRAAPFVQISRHGLALWFTSPHYLELVRPARKHDLAWSFGVTAAVIAVIDLLYQNSGWVQFGYRFSNDYALFLVALVALTGRKIGKTWVAVLLIAIGINAFGAATFDRANNIYQGDNDSNGMFQPD